MGIKPDIIKEDIGVFSKQCVIPYDSTYKPMDRSAVFFDLTSMLYKLTKPAAKDRTLMTSEEFKDDEKKNGRYLAELEKPYCSVIFVWTIPSIIVPKEKEDNEAARRVAAAKTEQKRVSNGLTEKKFEAIYNAHDQRVDALHCCLVYVRAVIEYVRRSRIVSTD